MIKIIKEELFRLRKSSILISSLIITIIIALTVIGSQYYYFKHDTAIISFDIIWFYTIVLGFFIAIFISLFTGSDFTSRTINYKIISGYKRITIYLSYLVIGIIFGILCLFTYITLVLLLGLFFMKGTSLSSYQIFILLIENILLIITYSSLFTLLTVLFGDKTLSVVISTILVFGLTILCFIMLDRLKEEEYIKQYNIMNNGVQEVLVNNPNYLTGDKRKMYELTTDILPMGTAIRISNLSILERDNIILYYGLLIITFNTLGIIILNKKELR